MIQERLIKFDGIVTEALANNKYRVQFSNGHEIIAYTQGDMPEASELPISGDRITVEISPTDLNSGRLIFQRKIDAV